MQPAKEWFSEWFNSPYYHVLYKNRDEKEAEYFLTNLINYLKLKPQQHIIDLACGKGRHSIFLNQAGLKVTGVDLSENSIEFAKLYENANLKFNVSDLRNLPYQNEFDVALNLFTSFGYFNCEQTNIDVLFQIKKALKPNGILLIDFFNAVKVLNNLVVDESKTIDGIHFKITRLVKNGLLIKTIAFHDLGIDYLFHEKVQVLNLNHFESMLKHAGFSLINTFGDYQLNGFVKNESDRLILLAQKND